MKTHKVEIFITPDEENEEYCSSECPYFNPRASSRWANCMLIGGRSLVKESENSNCFRRDITCREIAKEE